MWTWFIWLLSLLTGSSGKDKEPSQKNVHFLNIQVTTSLSRLVIKKLRREVWWTDPSPLRDLLRVLLQHTSLHSPPFVHSFCDRDCWLGTTDLKWLTQDNGNTKGDRQQAAGSAVIPPTYWNCFRGLSIIGIPWSCKLHNNKLIHWRHDSINFTR